MSKNSPVRLVLCIEEQGELTPVSTKLKGLVIDGEYVLPLGDREKTIACLRMLIDLVSKRHA